MNLYNVLNVKLSNLQLINWISWNLQKQKKEKERKKKEIEVTVNLSLNGIGNSNDENNFPYKLSLIKT